MCESAEEFFKRVSPFLTGSSFELRMYSCTQVDNHNNKAICLIS